MLSGFPVFLASSHGTVKASRNGVVNVDKFDSRIAEELFYVPFKIAPLSYVCIQHQSVVTVPSK